MTAAALVGCGLSSKWTDFLPSAELNDDNDTETECNWDDGGDRGNNGVGGGGGVDAIPVVTGGCCCLAAVKLDICDKVEIIELVKSFDLFPIDAWSSGLLWLLLILLLLLVEAEVIGDGGLDGWIDLISLAIVVEFDCVCFDAEYVGLVAELVADVFTFMASLYYYM